MRRSRSPRLWTGALLALVVVPLLLSIAAGPLRREGLLHELAASSGIVGLSLLVAAFALPSRLRLLTNQLGIETVLRGHRVVALLAVAFVLAHVAFVLLADPAGLGVLDLRHAPARVWAAVVATVSLLLLVLLAATRRRRRPRYERWRLAHLTLAVVVLAAAGLHVLWLHNLVDRPVMRWWFAALLAVVLGLVVYRWAWRPIRSWRRSYVVEAVRPESQTVVTVVLRAVGHPGVGFRPGQFVWLKFGGSPFTFEEHPFTIASAATRPGRKEFTVKALGDFSELLAALRPGRRVYLDGPHGRFTIDGLESAGFVFIAGGVGVTPMLSMVRTLADRGDARPHVLVVGANTADELLHRDEVAALRERLDLRVVEVVGEPPESWAGERGYVNAALIARYLPHVRRRRRRDYFVCGPPAMVGTVLAALRDLGVPDARIHTELFDMV